MRRQEAEAEEGLQHVRGASQLEVPELIYGATVGEARGRGRAWSEMGNNTVCCGRRRGWRCGQHACAEREIDIDI